MSSTMEHFSHPNHTLILYDTFLKECDIEEDDVTCYICKLPLAGSPAYTCTARDHQTIILHKSCTREDILCYGCGKTVIGFPTYGCLDRNDEDCSEFFLHKTCATLPKQINHQKHKKHPLTLHPGSNCRCNVCGKMWELFKYTCENCNFDVCVFCAFKERALGHEGHKKRRLTLEEEDRRDQILAQIRLEGRQKKRYTREHFTHPNHPLVSIFTNNGSVLEDFPCHICNIPVGTGYTFMCSSDDVDCRKIFFHSDCGSLPREIHHQNHKQHSISLELCPDCVCDVCGVDVKKFGYACGVCSSFILCVFCAYEATCVYEVRRDTGYTQFQQASYDNYDEEKTLEHFTHPKHPLILKENDIFGEDEICHVCNKPVMGSPTYTCNMDDDDCEIFYLHKSCAELPIQINHNLDKHHLSLLPRPDGYLCAVCDCKVKYAYACDDCKLNVCVFCGFEQRVINHEGHQHILTLQKEAWFKCDACAEEAKDYSYVCTTCTFWIHKKCAFAPFTIPNPTYHHHPLSLIYSVPEMHRYFNRLCAICDKLVQRHHWLYYCHKCTFFVHMKCSTYKHNLRNEVYSYGNEPNLVQFPLSSEESLFDLIVTQCAQLQINFQGEGENGSTLSTIIDSPNIIEQHWSHPEHPLGLFQFTENDDDDDNDDRRVLICDGCIQPITIHHPSYYGCIQCEYFLHSFCATKLPLVFPAEVFPFHPHHSLLLRMEPLVYSFINCGACKCDTNGFYYQCETCDMTIDIRCAFLPTRIKHKSHRHHSLVQRPLSNIFCSVSKLRVVDRAGYACESCNFFTIDIRSAFYPSTIKHKFDDNDSHDITLRHPPFFYEGVFYCEICEEQVNNQWWLYHCDKSDHSYHHNCLQCHTNVKLGRTCEIPIDNEKHTLAPVMKRTTRKNSRRFVCRECNRGYRFSFFLECEGCGYLLCHKCVVIMGQTTDE